MKVSQDTIIPEDLVSVPNPSIALENGLLFRLLRVGVVMANPSPKLFTLLVLPPTPQLLSGRRTALGVALMTAARYRSASRLAGTSD